MVTAQMPVKIFISHSCKDATSDQVDWGNSEEVARYKRLSYAQLVRNKIVDGLGKPKPEGLGYRILLDRDRLEPGDLWRAKLRSWLGICQGAVLLLSEDSVRSDWVRTEATILTYRKASCPEILLVPVYLGDLAVEELKKHGLDSLQLSEIQGVRLTAGDTPGGGGKVEALSDAEREVHATLLAQKVIEEFRGLSALNLDTHLERWVKSLTTHLKTVDLEEVCAKLLIDDQDWSDDGEYIEKYDVLGRAATVAYQLLSADFSRVLDAMKVLRELMAKERFQWLVPRIACQWVDLQAAQRLLRGAGPRGVLTRKSRLLALNSSFEETADAYVNRAHCCELPSTRILNVNKLYGEELELELVTNFEKLLVSQLNLPRKLQEAERIKNQARREKLLQQRDELLKTRLAQQDFYVILDLESTSEEINTTVLDAVCQKQDDITFLLLAGDSFAAIQGDTEIIEKVEPVLTEDTEQEALAESGALGDLLD